MEEEQYGIHKKRSKKFKIIIAVIVLILVVPFMIPMVNIALIGTIKDVLYMTKSVDSNYPDTYVFSSSKNKVFYKYSDLGSNYEEVERADADSFEVLSWGVGADKDYVYSYETRLENVDRATFQEMLTTNESYDNWGQRFPATTYWVDKDNLYCSWAGFPLVELHDERPERVTITNSSTLPVRVTDGNYVYSGCKMISEES